MTQNTTQADGCLSHLTAELDVAKKRISTNRDLLNENLRLGKLVLKEHNHHSRQTRF